jgi:hypothetical protein
MKNNYQTTSTTRSKKQVSIYVMLFVVLLMSTTSLKAQVPNYVPTNGLVGWWPFNGNANDESGNGNNGTVNGATLTSDRFGLTNKAYDFNGISNFIDLANYSFGIIGNSDRTISGWIKTTVLNYKAIFSSGSGVSGNPCSNNGKTFNMKLANGRLSVMTYNCGTCSTCDYYPQVGNNVSDNNWHYLVVSLKNDTLYTFVDSSIDNITVLSQTNTSGNSNYIGKDNHVGYEDYFQGIIDDIGIWNRALTQQEIIALYNGCQLSINTQPTNQNITINNNAQFIVNSSDPNATYQWQTDLGVGFQNLSSVGQYSGANNDTLTVSYVTFANNNQPFRCIINSGSCSDTSNVAVLTVNNNVGINEISNNNLFAIYPNPANAIIKVKSDAQLIGKTYFIFDNLGKTILTGKITSENMSIDINNLSEGNYLIGIDDNSKKQSFKVIKN